MRYVYFGCMLLVIVTALLAPIPTKYQDGTYNTVSHLAYCKTHGICLHEIGHALDQQAGWVSQTPGFHRALQMYLYTEFRKPVLNKLPADILEITYRGGDGSYSIKMEIYAYLFQWSDGKPENMPEGLRRFYDWKTAEHLLSILNKHQKLYWMN